MPRHLTRAPRPSRCSWPPRPAARATRTSPAAHRPRPTLPPAHAVDRFSGRVTVAVPLGSRYVVSPALSTSSRSCTARTSRTTRRSPILASNSPRRSPTAAPSRAWAGTCPRAPVRPHGRSQQRRRWLYVGPDGSEHLFYAKQHEDDAGQGAAGISYTRDGWYLRLREVPEWQWETAGVPEREVHFPNGLSTCRQARLVVAAPLDGRPVQRHGSPVTPATSSRVVYSGNRLHDHRLPRRSHTVTLYMITPDQLVVDSVALDAFGSRPATYAFATWCSSRAVVPSRRPRMAAWSTRPPGFRYIPRHLPAQRPHVLHR